MKQDQYWKVERLEAAGMLTASVAHDFNNLLMMINAHADSALTELGADSAAAPDLLAIQKLAEKAGALSGQLLRFLGQHPSEEKLVDWNSIIAESSEIFRGMLGGGASLQLELCEQSGLISADPMRLEQILLNLLGNAREAMDQGGVVTLRTSKLDTVSRLEVIDNGPGIDEATRLKMFEPFFTTRAENGGTGVGLATVAAIVDEAGGTIAVETKLGAGTCFRIDWPLG